MSLPFCENSLQSSIWQHLLFQVASPLLMHSLGCCFCLFFCFLTFSYNYFGVMHACEGQRATYRKGVHEGNPPCRSGRSNSGPQACQKILYLLRHLPALICLMWALTRQVALAALGLNDVDQAALKSVIILLPLECASTTDVSHHACFLFVL